MTHEMTVGPIRIDFPNVFTPQKAMNAKPEEPGTYNLSLLFDKSNAQHVEQLNKLIAACDQVLLESWPSEATRPRIPHIGQQNSPVKDGDIWVNTSNIPQKEKYPQYAGHYIIRVARGAALGAPHVVDMARNPILDQGQIYSGAWCYVNINPYKRENAQNPGISIGLNGVQKYAEGERLGGGGLPAVESMFQADPSFNAAAVVPSGQVTQSAQPVTAPQAPVTQPVAQGAAQPTPADYVNTTAAPQTAPNAQPQQSPATQPTTSIPNGYMV